MLSTILIFLFLGKLEVDAEATDAESTDAYSADLPVVDGSNIISATLEVGKSSWESYPLSNLSSSKTNSLVFCNNSKS